MTQLRTDITNEKQVIYSKPDLNGLAIPITLYPTIIVYFSSITNDFRGASTRYQSIITAEIHAITRNAKGVSDAAWDNLLMLENIADSLRKTPKPAYITDGWLKVTNIEPDQYSASESGFISRGVVRIEIVELLH
jgi:hypothetical protein